METFAVKAARAPVCNAGKFVRPLAIRLGMHLQPNVCMPLIRLHSHVFVCS